MQHRSSTVCSPVSALPVASERDGYALEVGEAVLSGRFVFVSANYRAEDATEAGHAVALLLDTEADTLSPSPTALAPGRWWAEPSGCSRSAEC